MKNEQGNGLDLGVLRPQCIVCIDIAITFPRVGEPDVGGVDSGKVGNVVGKCTGFGFEPVWEEGRMS